MKVLCLTSEMLGNISVKKASVQIVMGSLFVDHQFIRIAHYWRPAEIASKGPARKANCGAKEKAITEFFQILYTEQ